MINIRDHLSLQGRKTLEKIKANNPGDSSEETIVILLHICEGKTRENSLLILHCAWETKYERYSQISQRGSFLLKYCSRRTIHVCLVLLLITSTCLCLSSYKILMMMIIVIKKGKTLKFVDAGGYNWNEREGN